VSTPAKIAAGRHSRSSGRVVRAAMALAALYALAATPTKAEVAPSETLAAIPASLTVDTGTADNSDIQARLDSVAQPVIAGQRLHTELLREFYAAHQFQPVWSTHQAQAAALLGAVMRSGENGLNPDLFHAALLRNLGSLASTDRELLLSDAFLGYADALARGILPVEERMDDEDLRPEPVSIPAVLDNAINSDNPAAVIEALAPQSADYLALRRALQSYRQAMPAGAPIHSEAGYRRTAQRTDQTRVRDIEANLERLRWLPRHLPPDRVWVNLPTEQLILYRNNQPVFTTRVIIGQKDWQTPEMQTEITSILYNPPWNVPPSIAQEEILPKLSRDPGYLARHHMVWRANGMLQQVAGRGGSALGRLKFEMPDRFDVYLHDTPEKALFHRDNRTISHGCVRVMDPRELAALVLQQPIEAIDQAIARGATNHQMLPQRMPVFFVYQTAFLGPNGTIEFRPDIYARDPEIWQHLNPTAQAPVAQGETARQPRG
jgi:murein L,D-transpeptidase YcbB/YkuD